MTEPEPAADPAPAAAAKPTGAVDLAATMSQGKVSIETSLAATTAQVQASLAATASEPAIGGTFGRYKIERELGKGAMGIVYLAEDIAIGRKVALKIPRKSILEEPDALERFYREAKTTALLQHPNICPVFDVGAIDGTHYIAMAYIPGKPVSSFLGTGKLPPARQVALLIRKLALALEKAHNLGVVHRDLKPANVMLDDRNEPIVMDFGLARNTNTADNARLTQSGAILGTPAYMAPEQVRGDQDEIGPQSDIYALGVMMYQFLTGELPFTGPIMLVFAKIINERPQRPSELRPDVDPTLEAICWKMMAKEKSQRYGSMKEVAEALTEYLKTGSVMGLEAALAQTVLNAEPDWANLPLLPGWEEGSERRARSKKKPEQVAPPEHPWTLLRQQPWFWPAALFLVTVPAAFLMTGFLWWAWHASSSPSDTKSLGIAAAQKSNSSPPAAGISAPNAPPVSPPKPDYAAERALADWALKEQTRFWVLPVNGNGQVLRVLLQSELPAGDFTITGLDLHLQRSPEGILVWRADPISAEGWRLIQQSQLGSLSLPHVPLPKQDLAKLVQCTSLQSLGLSDTGFTDEDVSSLKPLTRLTGLYLQRTRVTNEGLRHLNAFPQLISLSLSELAIDDDGLRQIQLKSILNLTIARAEISDAGLQHLLHPPKGDMVSCDFTSTNVTDQTVERIATPRLQSLSLGDTAITDRALDHLDAGTNLQYLDVRTSQITAARVRRFSEKHPQCEILFLEGDTARSMRNGKVTTERVLGPVPPRRRKPEPVTDATDAADAAVSPPSLPDLPRDAPPLAIAPFNAQQATAHQQAWADYLGVPVEWENDLGMKFMLIPPGEFLMGTPASDKDQSDVEIPQHRVKLTNPFYLGRSEVTQRQWTAVMGTEPWQGQAFVKSGSDYPATYISWNDTKAFCEKLSQKEGKTYQLPTEAEWEYACRGGTNTKRNFGGSESRLGAYAWYGKNALDVDEQYAHQVGLKQANPFELFDMYGNVFEWCRDVFDASAYGKRSGVTLDPFVNTGSDSRVLRGGSWKHYSRNSRSADRSWISPDYRGDYTIGFRLSLRVDAVNQTLPKKNQAIAPPPAIAPFNAKAARAHQEAWAKQLGVSAETANSLDMKLVLVPPGEFLMGCPDSDKDAHLRDKPQHTVRITKPFYLSRTEVTQGQWKSVMGTKPWKDHPNAKEGDDYPATNVSWNEAAAFCRQLGDLEGQTYQLPTEAEWEYACRAGTQTTWSSGETESRLAAYAWYGEKARVVGHTFPHYVGKKQPNPFGLCDMHGNVREWCRDVFDENVYGKRSGTTVDPLVTTGSEFRSLRGGSWGSNPRYTRSGDRVWYVPGDRSLNIGFRVSKTI